MPRLFEHRHQRSLRSRIPELDRGNNAFPDTMIEVFKEYKGSSLPCRRKRIGIEAMRRAGNGLPFRTGQISGTPYARVVRVPPTDAPMRRITAETIDSFHDLAGEPAKDIGGWRSGTLVMDAVDLLRRKSWLSGLELADATIIRHGELYYLFGATRDGAGGYSDTLSLFYAQDLFGPWLPHASNPVMIDRTSARPAGNFVTINGQTWRPVQDCTVGYGCALGLAEVVELSPTSFKQIVRHTIRPGPLWTGRKLHTLNRCGRLELIDGTSIQPKIPAFGLPGRRPHSNGQRELRLSESRAGE